MFKKTLLSATIASTLALGGCLDDTPDTGENAGSFTNANTSTTVYPVFSPAESALPIPNDLIFDSAAGDGSFSVSDTSPPVTTALNGLSGASTLAPIDIAMSGLIAEDSILGPGEAEQNVWLIALTYASEDPVQGLSNQEPPTVNPGAQPSYTVEHKVLDGNSTIRIHPTTPLDPRTRYVVAITKGITDTLGNPIDGSPGAAGYNAVTDATAVFSGALAGLATVQALVNSLWEPTALGLINTVRGAFTLDPITDENIALTYSFTTSDDAKVLDYIAEPTAWLEDRIKDLIRVGAAEAAITGGAADYTTVKATVDAAYSAWLPSSLNAALAGCDAAPAGDARVTCAATNLFAAFEAGSLGFTANFPDPEATAITMNGAPVDVTTVVPSLAASIPAGAVLVDQGTMTIPYYSGLPSGFPADPTETTAAAGAGLPLKYASWEPDAALATTLNVAFYCSGLAIPQGNTAPPLGSADQLDCSGALNPANFDTAPGSEVVNYIFPFPAKQDDVTIPVLAIYPNPAAIGGATSLKTMIWGHGLTGDRSNALGFGSLLVAQGISNAGATAGASLNAVIAIDEPLHGVVSGALEGSAFGAVERHFGFQDAGTGPTNPPALIEEGGSGSMFINLESFLTARDNNRQHVLDLFTLRKSLETGNGGGAVTLSGNTLDGNYFYSGHSLGTINSQAFVAIANDTAATDDNITAAAFFTPGGGIARFFENSPAFAGILADGLAANGITPDTSNYQAYLNVFQAANDAYDAANFADRFDGAAYGVNYFLAANDLVIPVDVSTTERTFQSVTTPGGNTISGSISFLSGAEPLVTLAGADPVPTTAGNQPITQSVARYIPCAATHGTPSLPDGSDVPDSATYANNAFVENLSHTVGLLTSNGTAVTVTPNFATLRQDLPLPDLILDESTGCAP